MLNKPKVTQSEKQIYPESFGKVENAEWQNP
jgi:hypothetical protein